jgi:hypothetical protein
LTTGTRSRTGDLDAGRRTPSSSLSEETSLLGVVAVVASQTVLITAVLTYFGWARTNAMLAHFGLDPTMIGYETFDYVLRSLSIAFPAAMGITIVGLAMLALHRGVIAPRMIRFRDFGDRIAVWIFVGLLLLAAMLLGAITIGVVAPTPIRGRFGVLMPLLIVIVTILVTYLDHLRRTYALARLWTSVPERRIYGRNRNPTRRARYTPRDQISHSWLTVLLLTALGLLGAFWAAGLYASSAGKRIAQEIVDDLAKRPQVVLFSEQQVHLTGNGIRAIRLGVDGDRYRFQYSGLTMLARSEKAYLLLPVGWERGRDRVFIIPDDGSIRIDVIAG